MLEIYGQKLAVEISQASFVAVQADETTDVACVNQCVIVLRYITDASMVVERFLTFSPLLDRTAAGRETLLLEKLQPFKLENKLIAQTYDGAAVMSGASSGLQARQGNVPTRTLCALLCPPVKHHHGVLISHTRQNIFCQRLSFCNVFLQGLEKKRTAILDEVCGKRIPASGQTRWNLKSRTVHTVFEHQDTLKVCFGKIQDDQSWDSVSVQQAHGLSALLGDDSFLFFLSFFHSALMHIDILYNVLQKRTTDSLKTRQALENFSCSTLELKDKLTTDDNQPHPDADTAAAAAMPRRARRSDSVSVATQCCDIMIE